MAGTDILVLRALGIGDLLVTVPALRGLRAAFGGRHLVLAAPAGLADLVALTGSVDELLPTAGLGRLHRPNGAPAVAVNLHGGGPRSIEDLAGVAPDRLLSHAHPAFPSLAGPQWTEEVHEVGRWCQLLRWYGIDADPTDLSLASPAASAAAPGAVVVHPGAGYPSRRWPPDRFGAVARNLAAAGHQVVVTGGEGERALGAAVVEAAGLPPAALLSGRLDLGELAALVARARAVVSNDTGVGHLATAYGTPSVLLFGPTSPRRWGPPPSRSQHVALWAGRTGDPFAGTVADGLLELTVADVTATVTGLLDRV